MMQEQALALPPVFAAALGIERAPRSIVELLIGAMIDDLDRLDGEEDAEPNGDEEDGNAAEDDFMHHAGDRQVGCPVADPGEYAWPEWQSRGRHKNPEWRGTLPHEDAEDDDPDTGQDEAEPDMRAGIAGYGPGCIISDPDKGAEDEGEIETWSSWMDHEPSAHIGVRRALNDN